MKSRHLLSATLLSCLLPALAQAKPPASESDRQKAIEHFKLGNQAFADGDSLQAYTEYTAAWSFHESFDIACNLGRTEAELGKSRDAAEHLAYCLTNFSASARPEIRSAEGKLREVFREVQKRVGRVTLRVQPDGAVVRVDGAIVGKAPLRRDLYLDPGDHEVDVRMTGYDTVRRVVHTARDDQQELMLELVVGTDTPPPTIGTQSAESQQATGEAASGAPGAPPDDGAVPTRSIVLFTAGGLSVVGLGIGTAYWFQSRQRDGDVRQARRAAVGEFGDGGCGLAPDASQCEKLNQALEDRNQARTLSVVGFTAGGLLALGTLATYLWWPPAEAPRAAGAAPPPRAAWAPVVGEHDVGLLIWGSL